MVVRAGVLLDGVRGEPRRGVAIAVEGDVITAVGADASTPVPAGALEVDLRSVETEGAMPPRVVSGLPPAPI